MGALLIVSKSIIERNVKMSWQKIYVNHNGVNFIFSQTLPVVVKSGNHKLPPPLMSEMDEKNMTTIYFPPESVSFWAEILSEFSPVFCDSPDEPVEPMIKGMS